MTEVARPGPQQTPAQWALRWNGVVLFVLLLASAPVLHWYWHNLRGVDEPMVLTSSTLPRPEFTWAGCFDGTWLRSYERWLMEDSPVVFELRGAYNELRWRLGLLQTKNVYVGGDGWMFLRRSLHPDPARIAAEAEHRRALFAAIRREADELGVLLLAMVVPDKERIYPELAYGPAGMPAAKAGLYPLLLDELRAAGIPAVDVATALAAARAQSAEPVFHARDTHWQAPGALAGGTAVAAVLRAPPFAERLGPAWRLELTGPARLEVNPDLVGLAGFRCELVPDAQLGRLVNRPASAVTFALMAPMDYYGVAATPPDGAGPALPQDQFAAAAPVALAGSSMSLKNGGLALAYALQRPVDQRGVSDGASALGSLVRTFRNIRSGAAQARVVVWEFVERAIVEDLGTFAWPR